MFEIASAASDPTVSATSAGWGADIRSNLTPESLSILEILWEYLGSYSRIATPELPGNGGVRSADGGAWDQMMVELIKYLMLRSYQLFQCAPIGEYKLRHLWEAHTGTRSIMKTCSGTRYSSHLMPEPTLLNYSGGKYNNLDDQLDVINVQPTGSNVRRHQHQEAAWSECS